MNVPWSGTGTESKDPNLNHHVTKHKEPPPPSRVQSPSRFMSKVMITTSQDDVFGNGFYFRLEINRLPRTTGLARLSGDRVEWPWGCSTAR